MKYQTNNPIMQLTDNLSDRLFDENRLYSLLEEYLESNGLSQSLALLPYMKEKHQGQVRQGKDKVPYYSHPLQVACHAIALGFIEDDLISAALLHDICEDCAIPPGELPASKETQLAVSVLTKQKLKKPEKHAGTEKWMLYHEQERLRNHSYYEGIRSNRIAAIVKLLDRCNNLSCMCTAWKPEKLAEYIIETEEFILPLLQSLQRDYPEYTSQCFLIQYHMQSVMESVRHLILPQDRILSPCSGI
ncbi:MAG: hypothetical protein Q4B85_00825 [Lachnospiraceae bacterium]|nr:hypothetical protein [Lachnospiraceae bacterium]